jgi:hypothetical protein
MPPCPLRLFDGWPCPVIVYAHYVASMALMRSLVEAKPISQTHPGSGRVDNHSVVPRAGSSESWTYAPGTREILKSTSSFSCRPAEALSLRRATRRTRALPARPPLPGTDRRARYLPRNGRHEPDDGADGDAQPADARLPAHHLRIKRDSRKGLIRTPS